MKLIFVSGPYSAPDDEQVKANLDRACAEGMKVKLRGHLPVIPHLLGHGFDTWHVRTFGGCLPYRFYLDWDIELLRRCDGLLYYAPSPGADREMQEAVRLGLEVWTRAEDIPMPEEWPAES